MAGIAAVWGVGAVIAVVIGIFLPIDERGAWLGIGLGVCVSLAFVVQLVRGQAEGFLRRVALSVLGALVVMGVIGLGFAVAAFFA